MKHEAIFALFIVTVYGKVSRNEVILGYSREQNEAGYNFEYLTSDGQLRQEKGVLEKMGENVILRVTGSYSYVDSAGKLVKITYKADEDGYKPHGDFIPPTKTIAMNEKLTEKDNPSTEKPTKTEIVEQGTSVRPEEATELLEIVTPGVGPPLEISSAAIASLAGGGLG